MPQVSDRYDEKKPWFSPADIPDSVERKLVVGKLELDAPVGRRGDKRDILWFQNEEQYLFVDRFTGPTLVQILGGNSDDWPGKPIVLYTEMVDVRGENRPVLRIKASADTPPPKVLSPEEIAARRKAEIDDEIPF
jgi:hypothetical protein